jgi:hypothetical protein
MTEQPDETVEPENEHDEVNTLDPDTFDGDDVDHDDEHEVGDE